MLGDDPSQFQHAVSLTAGVSLLLGEARVAKIYVASIITFWKSPVHVVIRVVMD